MVKYVNAIHFCRIDFSTMKICWIYLLDLKILIQLSAFSI